MPRLYPAALTLMAGLLCGPFSVAQDGSNPAFEAALQALLQDPQIPLSLQVHCTDEHGIRSMSLYPGGVVIWNQERQARIGTAERGALAQSLLDAGFASFADHYGGTPGAARAGAPVIVLCSIDARAGGVAKSSYQDVNGERSQAFMALAGSLLDQVAPLAAHGVRAESLDDGLAKLRSGQLAPEALTLRLMHLPTETEKMGSIVDLSGTQLSRRNYRPGVQIGEPQLFVMSPTDMESLLAALMAAELTSLPAHPPAPDLYQLNVQVLQYRHSVRARPAAGKTEFSQQTASDRLIQLTGVLQNFGRADANR